MSREKCGHILQRAPVQSVDLRKGSWKGSRPLQRPWEFPALPQIFLNGRDLPCHITKRRDQVPSLDVHEIRQKGRGPSQWSWEGLCPFPHLQKVQDLPCLIPQIKDPVQTLVKVLGGQTNTPGLTQVFKKARYLSCSIT